MAIYASGLASTIGTLPRWKAALLLGACGLVGEQSLVLLEYGVPLATGPHPGHRIGLGFSEMLALVVAFAFLRSSLQKKSPEVERLYRRQMAKAGSPWLLTLLPAGFLALVVIAVGLFPPNGGDPVWWRLLLSPVAFYFGLAGAMTVGKRMYPPLPPDDVSAQLEIPVQPPTPATTALPTVASNTPGESPAPSQATASPIAPIASGDLDTPARAPGAKLALWLCSIVAAHGLVLVMTASTPSAVPILPVPGSPGFYTIGTIDLVLGSFSLIALAFGSTPEMRLQTRRSTSKLRSPLIPALTWVGTIAVMMGAISLMSLSQPNPIAIATVLPHLVMGLALMFAGVTAATVAYRRIYPPLPPAFAAMSESEQDAVLLTIVHPSTIPNTYLSRRGDRNFVFACSTGEKRSIALFCGFLLTLFSFVDSFVFFGLGASAAHRHTVTPLTWIMAVCNLLAISLFGPVTRRVLVSSLNFDVETRKYRQVSVDFAGWRAPSRQTDMPLWWYARRIFDGSIDRDLSGVGIRVTSKSSNNRTILFYQVVAAWRDDKHPGALLSQYYRSETYADAAMREIAVLLGVPALGELNIV